MDLAAAGGAAAVFAFVAGAVGRHEHAALGACGRAVEHGTRICILRRRIVMGRRAHRMRYNWHRQCRGM